MFARSKIKKCLVCGKEFYCYNKRQDGSYRNKLIIKRRSNAVTCSKNCSKILLRFRQGRNRELKEIYIQELKDKGKTIEKQYLENINI